jgi:hypothetical protein
VPANRSPEQSVRQKIDLHRVINNLIVDILEEMGLNISSVNLSQRTLKDIVTHYRNDIEKLKDHQNDSISLTKRIAGIAFWIRRLKPISSAYLGGREIQDINEQVCIQLAIRLLIVTADDPRNSKTMKAVQNAGKGNRLAPYLKKFFNSDNYSAYTNLIYSLRYRNWSPHHLAVLFDGTLTGFAISEGVA